MTPSWHDTHRVLDACCAVARALLYTQGKFIERLEQRIKGESLPVPWMITIRQFDGTPTDLSFGRLESELRDSARYRYREGEHGRWELLEHHEIQALGEKRSHGCLEVFAQSCKMVWEQPARAYSGAPVLRVEDIILPPQVLQDTSANCVWGALDVGVPGLGIDAWLNLCDALPYTLMCIGADRGSGNIRALHALRDRFRAHNRRGGGQALVLLCFCMAHLITRTVINVLKYTSVIPRLYGLCFVCQFPPRYNRLLTTMARLMEHDLIGRGGFSRSRNRALPAWIMSSACCGSRSCGRSLREAGPRVRRRRNSI